MEDEEENKQGLSGQKGGEPLPDDVMFSVKKRVVSKRRVKGRTPDIEPAKVKEAVNRASMLIGRGDLDDALEHLEGFLRENGPHDEIMYQIGNIYFMKGEIAEAESIYRNVIRSNPRSFRAYNNLGILLQQLGRKEDAIRAFNQALEINNLYERAWYNLGSIFMEIEPPLLNEASIFLRRAIECDPGYEKARRKLEECRSMMGG